MRPSYPASRIVKDLDSVHQLWKMAVTYDFAYLEKELRETENRVHLRRELARPTGLKQMLADGIPVDIISMIVSKNIDNPSAYYPHIKVNHVCDCGQHFVGSEDNEESDY